jgi:hypothetical protein
MKIETYMDFTVRAFNYLDGETENLTEEQLDWKSCEEANTIRNILGHLFDEWYGDLPKITSGVEVLEDDDSQALRERASFYGFNGVEGKSLNQIKSDLISGKNFFFSELGKISDEDLSREVEWFKGKMSIGNYLIIFIAEIFHHEGQIAAILGVKNRIKGL